MQKYWGLYSTRLQRWEVTEEHSNYDSPIGTVVYYPLKSIAEAHLAILQDTWPPSKCPWEVREFPAET